MPGSTGSLTLRFLVLYQERWPSHGSPDQVKFAHTRYFVAGICLGSFLLGAPYTISKHHLLPRQTFLASQTL